MGAHAPDDPRQGGAFLADYATFAEFLEKLRLQKYGFCFCNTLNFNIDFG